MKSESSMHCVTCWQPLSIGMKAPRYFAQEEPNWNLPLEAERAAGDLSRCLSHAKAVTSAMWSFLQIAGEENLQIDAEDYLDNAKSLRCLLTDLVEEISRRAETFVDLVEQKQAKTTAKNTEAPPPSPGARSYAISR